MNFPNAILSITDFKRPDNSSVILTRCFFSLIAHKYNPEEQTNQLLKIYHDFIVLDIPEEWHKMSFYNIYDGHIMSQNIAIWVSNKVA